MGSSLRFVFFVTVMNYNSFIPLGGSIFGSPLWGPNLSLFRSCIWFRKKTLFQKYPLGWTFFMVQKILYCDGWICGRTDGRMDGKKKVFEHERLAHL